MSSPEEKKPFQTRELSMISKPYSRQYTYGHAACSSLSLAIYNKKLPLQYVTAVSRADDAKNAWPETSFFSKPHTYYIPSYILFINLKSRRT
jgi:hypothetical protein